MVLDYSTQFYKLFETGTATYEIVGPNLRMENSNGDGVTFRTEDDAGPGNTVRCPGGKVTADDADLTSGAAERNAFVGAGLIVALAMTGW